MMKYQGVVCVWVAAIPTIYHSTVTCLRLRS
uniref:Uncharacterized protein n=1 Tax=Myoviridae sp. ctTn33 TaxID=2825113 RepID=A0A8S5TXX9_9CAUD|nr:MAG TPA: hypothetical protein [Myoviridae sp. ctTn33]